MSDRFPTEIWTQIFHMACLDGDNTACAISEVSHYLRAIILPFQLDNVALVGPTKLVLFSELLHKREAEPAIRRVRHLFLSRGSNIPTVSKAAYDAALGHILRTTAPDLITLTSTLHQMGLGPESVLCIPFPKLEELTIHAHFLTPSLPPSGVRLQPSFPALTHLHILSSCENGYLYTSRAPALTHLRFSAVVKLTLVMYQSICSFLLADGRYGQPIPLPGSLELGPNVQKIFIQTDMAFSSFWRTHEHVRYGPLMHSLMDMNDNEKLVVFDAPVQSGRVGLLHMGNERKHWAERIVGGPGCWVDEL
ncbi:hypothetical protein BDW22DRAFT_1173864 [Trametopsis cervina]|nr:hypothetical protein BDW22DRAFT_1173864 [Trametopsis cervina]